jgi:hypothetical protein
MDTARVARLRNILTLPELAGWRTSSGRPGLLGCRADKDLHSELDQPGRSPASVASGAGVVTQSASLFPSPRPWVLSCGRAAGTCEHDAK